MRMVEVEELPQDWTEYTHKFVVLKGDINGLYFVREDGLTDYISLDLFNYIKSKVNNDIDKLIMLSGKYSSDDIVKFKREGMI
jgi:arginyl-tRNA synthetase